MKQTISACLVVYNEENVIERCLRSIQPIVDEIIVLHDGECKDQTLEIAKKFGAKIYIRPHIGTAEPHRAFAYEQASGDWILQLDADEFLSEPLRREIPRLVEDLNADGYVFAWPASNGSSYYPGPFSRNPRPCLFRREKLYFVAMTHSEPRTYGNLADRTDLVLEHWPQTNSNTITKMFSKHFRWSRMQAMQILQLRNVDTYQVPDLTKTDEYRYFTKLIRHPFLRGDIQVARLLSRCMLYFIRHPQHLFVFDNWKAMFILSTNLLYLSLEIALLKPRYRRDVTLLMSLPAGAG